jgi:Spy/CpxP family protein refolding chaperone
MKKVILSIASVALVATTSFANCKSENRDNNYCDKKQESKKACDGKGKGDYKRFKRDSSGPTKVMFGLASIDLSEKQKEKIREVMGKYSKAKKENFAKFNGYSSGKYFTKDGFDKATFIKERSANRTELVKVKAEFYNGLYEILTDKQKVEFVKALQ